MRKLLLLLLLVPLATAQDTTPTLDVTGSATGDFSIEAPTDITFKVAFASSNPFDTLQPRDIQLHVEGLAEGWVAQLAETSLTMAAGTTSDVIVTVSVSADAADTSSLTLRAQLVPRGVNVIPGAGPLLDPDAEGTLTLELERSESATRAVLEAVAGFIWPILAVLLALIAIVAFLVRQRNIRSVAISVPDLVVRMEAGGTETVPLQVRNLLHDDDTVVFQISHDKGWAAMLPLPELSLAGDEQQELSLIIHAPSDAQPGKYTIGVTAHSAASPRKVVEAIVTVQI